MPQVEENTPKVKELPKIKPISNYSQPVKFTNATEVEVKKVEAKATPDFKEKVTTTINKEENDSKEVEGISFLLF